MTTMTHQGQPQNAPLPGQLFDVPGVPGGETQWTDQYEDTSQLAITWSSSTQNQIQGISKMRQTDVVLDWTLVLDAGTYTFTAGTGQTITYSPYFPHVLLGPVKLLIQNQYASIDVPSGIDLFIFGLIRPYAKTTVWSSGGLAEYDVDGFARYTGTPAAATSALGYPSPPNAQANIAAGTYLTAPASGTAYPIQMYYRIPAAMPFDVYYDRAITGETVAPPHAAIVSPQYMAGTTRNITLSAKTNPLFGATLDVAPASTTALTPTSDSASTASASATLKLRRRGVFAGAAPIMPPVYGWQYRWNAQQLGIAGVSTSVLQLPLDAGQILSLYVRLFDPAANSGLGAPITLSTLTQINLEYGSGLLRFTGTPQDWQRRWIEQHGSVLPPGVFGFDLAMDEEGRLTNRRVLNTLTTAGILVRMFFSGATSSTAYAVLGVESLVYVT